MNKEMMITHHEQMITWVESLRDIPEEIWRSPVAEGKWSVAEVIGHFIPWDEFLLESRFPFFIKGELEALPPFPRSETEVNSAAAEEARRTDRETVITRFVRTRRQMIDLIEKMDDGLWNKPMNIGNSQLTLAEYFDDFIQHDLHHRGQVEAILD